MPGTSLARRMLTGAAVAVAVAAGGLAASQATTATHTSVADSIRQIELTRVHALVAGDTATAARLMAPDFQAISPAGADLRRDDYLAAVSAGFLDYLAFEPTSEIVVRRTGDAAALRY